MGAVIAKVGVFDGHGKVKTEAGVFEVRLGDKGWFAVAGTTPEKSGRVRYDEDHKLLEIERPGVSVSIHFLGETERTTFQLDGRMYAVGTMDFGEVSIREGERQVVKGHSTVSGVRLTFVDSDMQAIERELAFGLALRSSAIDKESWREDVVYPGRQYRLAFK